MPDDRTHPAGALPRRAGRLADRRALAVRRAGERAVGAGDRGAAAGEPRGRRAGRALRRRHRAAPARRARRRRRRRHDRRGRHPARPRGGRAADRRRGRRLGACSRRGSGSARRGRCCCRAGTRGGAPRCGSSGSGRRSCCRSRRSTSGSRSCWRRCGSVLQDVYDVRGLRELMADVRARKVRLVEVETPAASPFARSLLFGYVGMFLYETDAPLAERRAAALSLDSALLAELLGTEAIRELLDPEARAPRSSRSLQRLDPDRHARYGGGRRRPVAVPRRSDRRGGRRARDPGRSGSTELEAARRAIRVRIGGDRTVPGDRGRRPGARRARHGAAGGRARGVHRAGRGPARRPAVALRPQPGAVRRGGGGRAVRARRGRRAPGSSTG